jgi:copper chaperone
MLGCGTNTRSPRIARSTKMKTFKVSGMTCGHCAHAVERALSHVPGVTRVVEVSLDRGEAVIEGDPETDAVLDAIAREGQKAELSG